MDPDATPSSRSNLEVLVASDDAATRALVASCVRTMGYPIVTAAGGRQALAAFEASQPRLVVADWSMAHVDGLELCRRIRRQTGDQSFIILVGALDDESHLRDALAAGADDYVAAPLSAAHLRARLMIAERRLSVSSARRAADEETARMRWLAGIGETVVTVQHEINTPLTGLYAALHIIGESSDLTKHDRDYVDQAFQQAMRIADVVRQLALLEAPATIEMVPGIRMLSLTPVTGTAVVSATATAKATDRDVRPAPEPPSPASPCPSTPAGP